MEVAICKWAPPPIATRRLLAISAILGAVLGVAAVGGFRVAAAVEIFMSQFGLFVVVPAVIGHLATGRMAAVSAASTLLVIMCFVYYLPYADSATSFLLAAAVWTVFSLVAGPVFGLAGHALLTDDRRGASPPPASSDCWPEFLRMSQKGLNQGDLNLLSLTIIFDAVAVGAIGAMIRPGRLGRVVAYAIPMTMLGYLVTFVLR